MKKKLLTVVFALSLIFSTNLFAQTSLKETSLKQQIEKSNVVLEGKVVSQKSFWNGKYIYTANTVEVYKTFKGNATQTVEVITEGGTVGLQALIVSTSLKLNTGDVGIFALTNTIISNASNKSSISKYKPYGAVQGFYKYNVDNNVAVNPFNVKKGISETFYKEIMDYTKTQYNEVSAFDVKAIQSKSSQNKGVLAPSTIAFSPNITTGGTKSTITITIPGGNSGTNFGGTKGKVAFTNADDGGGTFINALDTQVTWASNSITVEVPSRAGTGPIKVTNADANNTFRISDTDLTVTSGETNVIYDEDDQTEIGGSNGPLKPKAYQVQHISTNGSGGYTWQMNTAFNANAPAKASFLRAFDTWRNTTGINWRLGATTTVDVAMFESISVESPATPKPAVNVIRFESDKAPLNDNLLGKCYSWYKGCSIGGGDFEWYVAEIDIVFAVLPNPEDPFNENWNFGPAATPLGFGVYDFESVALHELGHGHQLAHVIDNTSVRNNKNDVMNYSISFNVDQRTLAANNIYAASIIQERSTTNTVCNKPLMTKYSILGVEEEALNNGIKVYPNPTNGDLFISNDGLANLKKVMVYDISGRLISQQDISKASRLITVRLNNVSKGIYFVNIHSDKTFITKKIILE